jgi:hypothetical protein
MNSDQIDIVLQYLKIETNYAVIINGSYGVGKTHFYKTELVPKIKEISLPKNDEKKFIPIHVSLFGFRSLEEIQTAIFVELFPILKNKNLKLAASIGKSIIRGIAQLCNAGDIDKYIGDLNQDLGDWLRYDELVICFDDLDRKSESLDIRDVFGFINSLVENQGAKILLIANEERLIKDTNYSTSLREKVIGVSIHYKPDSKTIYRRIIENRYSSAFRKYHDFLVNSEGEIMRSIEVNQNNFRNLIYFLEHFRTIFYPLEGLFQADKNFLIQKNEKLQAILDFTLAISIEYKLGLLNSTNLSEVKGLDVYSFSNINLDLFLPNSSKKENADEPKYIDVFKKKYFPKKKYYFFKSIFEYITGVRYFNIDDLRKELDAYFIIEDGVVAEQNEVLNDLAYLECLRLSDKEYRLITLKMLSFLDEGKYQLQQFGAIFHYATRFNNILNFDIVRLKKRFKRGIKRGVHNYTYNSNLDLYLSVSNDTEFKEDIIEIIEFCSKVNNSLKETNAKNDMETLFELFQTDFDEFIEKVQEHDNEYCFTPIWIKFDFRKVIGTVNKLGNEQIWELGHYFIYRYRRHICEKLNPEKDFLIKLRGQIDKPTATRKKKNLHNASLNYLSKCLKECELNFQTS